MVVILAWIAFALLILTIVMHGLDYMAFLMMALLVFGVWLWARRS